MAGKGPLSCVQLLVAEEVGVLLEGEPTLIAGPWLLPTVHTQVLTEACVLFEAFATLVALERLHLPL